MGGWLGGWEEAIIRLISAEAEALLGLAELGNISNRFFDSSSGAAYILQKVFESEQNSISCQV